MRYLWVDAGNDPNFTRGAKSGIDGYFMPLFDARTTKAQLQGIRDRGLAAGVYVGHGWWQPISAQALADKVFTEFQRVRVQGLRLQMNHEQKDAAYILANLSALRAKDPTLPLSWTLEGKQGGWFTPSFVQALIDLSVRVVPQSFWGAEGRIDGRYAEDMILRDLTRRGLPETLVSLFYDGADLPRDYQGYVFTQGRLPA